MKKSPIIISLLFVFGCNNSPKKIQLKENSFHIFVADQTEKEINESRNRKIDLDYFTKLYFGRTKCQIDNINTRGQSALGYRRKNFSVNVNGKISIYDNNLKDTLQFEKFVLSSMSMDYTYIENKISHLLLKEIDLWPLHSFYTEVFINNHHQGLYLFIENLKEYASKKNKAISILRRGYNHQIIEIETKKDDKLDNLFKSGYNKYIATNLDFQKMEVISDPYIREFNHIYDILSVYKGKELYDSINVILNLENYMKKIAVDEILENGDYTDEIFFYSKSKKNEKITFDIIPWDYDDVFSSMPHEIGRADSLCGRCFGIRTYPTYDDFKTKTKDRLIFSIEDDLDYTIMRDDYLYYKYLEKLDEIVKKLNDTLITNQFDSIETELKPFYQNSEVINQSKFDEKPTELLIWKTNMHEKKNRLLKRLSWLRSEVLIQKKAFK